MKFALYSQVALAVDVPEHHLRKGDIATVADRFEKGGYVLEVFNALGESVDVLTLPESSLEPLQADELFQVRHFAAAA